LYLYLIFIHPVITHRSIFHDNTHLFNSNTKVSKTRKRIIKKPDVSEKPAIKRKNYDVSGFDNLYQIHHSVNF
jgi:hypothetical protein